MRNLNKEARNLAIKSASVLSGLYIAAVIILAIALENNFIYLCLLGAPLLFWLTYCFRYTLKTGIVSFLGFTNAKYYSDTHTDSYWHSEVNKEKASCMLVVIAFLPTVIFFFLFSWIWYLKKA